MAGVSWWREDPRNRWVLVEDGTMLAEVTDLNMAEADSLPVLAGEVFRTAGSVPPPLLPYLGG